MKETGVEPQFVSKGTITVWFPGSCELDARANERSRGSTPISRDVIRGTYDTVKCTCPVPDWMAGKVLEAP